MPNFAHRSGSFCQASEGTAAPTPKHDDQIPLMYGSAPASPQFTSAPPPRPRTSASGALDRPPVIPAMHRRLITLPTAGNLKISPLAPQRLQLRRPCPVLQSSSRSGHIDSDEAASTRAGSAAGGSGGGSSGRGSGGGDDGGGGGGGEHTDLQENDVMIVIDQRQGMTAGDSLGAGCTLTANGLLYDLRCESVFDEPQRTEAMPIALGLGGGSSGGGSRYDRGAQAAQQSAVPAALATATAVATGGGNSSRKTMGGAEAMLETLPVAAGATSNTTQPTLAAAAAASFGNPNNIALRRIEPGTVVVQLQASEGSEVGAPPPLPTTKNNNANAWPIAAGATAPLASATVPLKVVQLSRPRLDPDDATVASVAATGMEINPGDGVSGRDVQECWATKGGATLRFSPLGMQTQLTGVSQTALASALCLPQQLTGLPQACSSLKPGMSRPSIHLDPSLPDEPLMLMPPSEQLNLRPLFDQPSQLQLQPQSVASKTAGGTGDALRLLRAPAGAFRPLPARGGGGGGGSLNMVSHANNSRPHLNSLPFPGSLALAAPPTPANVPNVQLEVTVATRNNAASRQAGLTLDADGYARPSAVLASIRGIFDLHRYLAGRDCIQCGTGGGWMSRSQFEKVAGSVTAKWHRSIRVLPDLEPLGEWLERHGLPLTKGPSRRIFKRTIDGDLKTQLHHLLPLLDLGPGPGQAGTGSPAQNSVPATAAATAAKMGDLATGTDTGMGTHLFDPAAPSPSSGLQTLAVAAASLGETNAPPTTMTMTLKPAPGHSAFTIANASSLTRNPTDTAGWADHSIFQPLQLPPLLQPQTAPPTQLAQLQQTPLSLKQPQTSLHMPIQAPIQTAPSALQEQTLWYIGTQIAGPSPPSAPTAAAGGISGLAQLPGAPSSDLMPLQGALAPTTGVDATAGIEDDTAGTTLLPSTAANNSYAPQVHMLTGMLAVLHTRAQAQARGLLTDAVAGGGGGAVPGGATAAAAAAAADRNHVRQELGRTQAAIHHVQELLKRELSTVSLGGSGGTALPPPPGLTAGNRDETAATGVIPTVTAAAATVTPAVASTDNGAVGAMGTAGNTTPMLPSAMHPQLPLPALPPPQRLTPSQLQMPPPPPRPPPMCPPAPPLNQNLAPRRSGLPAQPPQLLLKRKAAVAAACEISTATAQDSNKCAPTHGYNIQSQPTRLYGIGDGVSVVGAVANAEGGDGSSGVAGGVGDGILTSLLAKRQRQDVAVSGGGGGVCSGTETEAPEDAGHAALVGAGGGGEVAAVESAAQTSTPGVIQLQGLAIMTIEEVHRRLQQMRQGSQPLHPQQNQQQNQQQPQQQLHSVGQPDVAAGVGSVAGHNNPPGVGGNSTTLAAAGPTAPAMAPVAQSAPATEVSSTPGVMQLQGLAVMTIEEVHRRLQQMRHAPHPQPQQPAPALQGRHPGSAGGAGEDIRIPSTVGGGSINTPATGRPSTATATPAPAPAPITMLCAPGFAAISVTEVQRRIQLQQLRQPDAREGAGHHEPAVQDSKPPHEPQPQLPLPVAAAVSSCPAPPVVTGDSLENPDGAAVGTEGAVAGGDHEPEASCCSTSASPRAQQAPQSQHAVAPVAAVAVAVAAAVSAAGASGC
uniref:RlsA n=1 Tax=Volvox ferrisii TaxID=1075618 RepID=A0A075M2H4_9CHLO|nr:RlsA [Volvox ferrisii]